MVAARQAWRTRRLFDGTQILDDRIVVAEDGIVSAILAASASPGCAVEELPEEAVLAPASSRTSRSMAAAA